MAADVAAAFAFEALHVGAAAMQVEREELVAERGRPLIGLVDHHADVGMSAAEIIGPAIARILPFSRGIEMPVIRDHLHPLVNGGILMRGELTHLLVEGAGDDRPEVADHRVDEKAFAVLIPIMPPRIDGALREHLDRLSVSGWNRQIPPWIGPALVFRSARADRYFQDDARPHRP